MPEVSIIILNWNGLNHLEECFASIAAQVYRDFEVILVDNGSSDGSQKFIKERYSWVRLVELAKNHGFATGNVIGLSQSLGSLIVTLNNDTKVHSNFLKELVRMARQYPDAGMVGARICSYYNHDQIDSLGVNICLDGMSRGNYRGRQYSSLPDISDEILLPSGCAALYRREMLDQTGFFAEDFFAYCEDTDLGLRGRLAGWKARLAKDAIVYHKYSATSGGFSPFKLYLVERNHFRVVIKNFPPILLLLLPLTTLFRYLMQALLVMRGTGAGAMARGNAGFSACFRAVMKGIWNGLGNPLQLLQERRAVQAGSRINSSQFLRLLLRHKMKFSQLLDADTGHSKGT